MLESCHSGKQNTVSSHYLCKMFASSHAGSNQVVTVPRKNRMVAQQGRGVGKEGTIGCGMHNDKEEAKY